MFKTIATFIFFAISVLLSCASPEPSASDGSSTNPNDYFNPSPINPTPDNPNPSPGTSDCVEDPYSPDYSGPCPTPNPTPDNPAPSTCGAGSIQGVICAPDGGPIAGATMTFSGQDCAGMMVQRSAQTDAQGRYVLSDVPSGQGQITITAGSFVSSKNVGVAPGEMLTLDGPDACLETNSARIAVITGFYDSVEYIINDLGFQHDRFCGGNESYGSRLLLSNPAELQTYQVLFVNCGLSIDFESGTGPQMAQNFRNFIEGGGSAYVSDVSAGLIARAFPGLINFNLSYDPYAVDQSNPCCTCGQSCPSECGAQPQATVEDEFSSCRGAMTYGNAYSCLWEEADPYLGQEPLGSLQANIINSNLRAALGRDSFTAQFDLDSWVSIAGVSQQVEVLIAAGNRPLMVRYTSPAGGKLIYTSFHNERQASQDLQVILRALIFEL